MKSLVLRGFALIALGLLAHTIKPFTSENLTAYAASTARTVACWLPAQTLARWEKTATLAAVLGQVWQNDQRADQVGWRNALLANLQPASAMAPVTLRSAETRFSTKSNARRTAWRGRVPAPVTVAAEEPFADETVADLQEMPTRVLPYTATQVEPLSLPIVISTGTDFSGQSPWLPMSKRAACEMPSLPEVPAPPQETNAEAGPMVEAGPMGEAAPMVEASHIIEMGTGSTTEPMRPHRPTNRLETEWQPISYRIGRAAQPRTLLIIKQVQKVATQC